MRRSLRSFACLVALAVGGCDVADPPPPTRCEVDPCASGCGNGCDVCPEAPGCFCAEDRARTCLTVDDCPVAPGDVWACLDTCCVELCDAAACARGCPSPLGCACDEGVCRPVPCSADAECAGRDCVEGVCGVRSAAPIASCELHPPRSVLVPGTSVVFAPALRDEAGRPLDPSAGLSLEAEGTVAVDGLRVEGLVPGEATVRLALDGGSCEAAVLVVAPPEPDESVVVVVEEETRAAVPGATVRAGAATATADAHGVARFAGLPALDDVDVVAPGFESLAVRGALGAVAILPLRPAPAEVGRAIRVARATEPHAPSWQAHLAGLSFPPSPRELGLRRILGPEVQRELRFPGTEPVLGGAGLELTLQSRPVLAPAIAAEVGACVASGCPRRALWSTAHDPWFDLARPRDTDVAWPVVGTLPSGAVALLADVELGPVRSLGSVLREPDGQETVSIGAVPALRVAVEVPPVPLGGVPTRGAFVGVAVELPGRGLVIRSLRAGADAVARDGLLDEPDDVVDGQLPPEVAPRPTGALPAYSVFAIAARRTPSRWNCGEDPCVEAVRVLHTATLPEGSVVAFDAGFLPIPSGGWDPNAHVVEVCADGADAVRASVYGGGRATTAWADGSCATIELPAGTDARLERPVGGYAVELQALDLDRPLSELVAPGGTGLDRSLDATSGATLTRSFL